MPASTPCDTTEGKYQTMFTEMPLKEPYNHGQIVIIEYLKKGLKAGKCFFKSKYIARDLGMTSKEVGTNLKILSGDCEDLHIEKWSYSKSTTWRVEPMPMMASRDHKLAKACN